jgi:hypothetical protein
MGGTKTEHHDNAQDARPTSPAAGEKRFGLLEPEAIAHRTYELFQERGHEPGRELDDWLRAEHELKQSNDDHASE